MTKDYAVTIKVRNNRLLQKMREAGYSTAASLSRATGINQGVIGEYLRMKRAPIRKLGAFAETVVNLADHLRCLPEDLFPPAQLTTALKRNISEFTADASDFLQISASLRALALPADQKMIATEAKAALDKLLDVLPPRERNVIEQRFGLIDGKVHTYDGVDGEEVTRERVRQIEQKALRRLQAAALRGGLSSVLRDGFDS